MAIASIINVFFFPCLVQGAFGAFRPKWQRESKINSRHLSFTDSQKGQDGVENESKPARFQLLCDSLSTPFWSFWRPEGKRLWELVSRQHHLLRRVLRGSRDWF